MSIESMVLKHLVVTWNIGQVYSTYVAQLTLKSSKRKHCMCIWHILAHASVEHKSRTLLTMKQQTAPNISKMIAFKSQNLRVNY